VLRTLEKRSSAGNASEMSSAGRSPCRCRRLAGFHNGNSRIAKRKNAFERAFLLFEYLISKIPLDRN